ncbi:MAG: TolC family protein [Vicinamibacteria bacterium]|nr:TolC family protein [Vicinamibacteria bacterium]
MRLQLRGFAFLLILAASVNAQVLTLDDALALALNGNRSLQITSLDVLKAGEQVAQAKSHRWPLLSTYAQAGRALTPIDFWIPKGALGSYPATGPIPGQASVIRSPESFGGVIYASAAQPLTPLWKVSVGISEAGVAKELAEDNLKEKRRDLAYQVKESYYQIVETQSRIRSAREALTYLSELEGLAVRNLEKEVVLRSDVLTVKARLSQARYQLVVLEDAVTSQMEAMNRLIGRDLEMRFSVEELPPPAEEIDLETARRSAAAQRAEVRRAALQAKKVNLDIQRQRAEYVPDISLSVSYLSFGNISFVPRNVFSVGLSLQWQPFDWGLRKHRMAELEIASRQAALSSQEATQIVWLDVNMKYRKLMETRALLDSQAAAQETAREKLRVLTHQYAQEAVLLADLLQQQAALAEADSAYHQALSAYWTARAGFDRAAGRN